MSIHGVICITPRKGIFRIEIIKAQYESVRADYCEKAYE